MVKRALTYIAAAVGMLLAIVFGLGILANTLVGIVGAVLAVPLYAMVFLTACGGVFAVWLVVVLNERSRP